jgi:hypothetical protein
VLLPGATGRSVSRAHELDTVMCRACVVVLGLAIGGFNNGNVGLVVVALGVAWWLTTLIWARMPWQLVGREQLNEFKAHERRERRQRVYELRSALTALLRDVKTIKSNLDGMKAADAFPRRGQNSWLQEWPTHRDFLATEASLLGVHEVMTDLDLELRHLDSYYRDRFREQRTLLGPQHVMDLSFDDGTRDIVSKTIVTVGRADAVIRDSLIGLEGADD